MNRRNTVHFNQAAGWRPRSTGSGRIATVLAAAMALCACGPEEAPAAESPVCDAGPGDFVITELLIDPVGEDSGLEFVEIVNASNRSLSLEGLTVISGSETRPKISTATGWSRPAVEPGTRIVVSESSPSAETHDAASGSAANLPGAVSVDSLVLPNQAGSLVLMCGGIEIDRVTWGTEIKVPDEGLSLQMAPTSTATDRKIWCPSAGNVDSDGNTASPGLPNGPCETGDRCTDAESGIARTVVRPSPGDAAFTEVFSNPKGTDRLADEWVEIVALSDFDMTGLSIRHVNGPDSDSPSRTFKIAGNECRAVKVGQVVVIGGPDGIPIEGQSTLYNATSGTAGIELLDPSGTAVSTARHPKVPDGSSVALKTKFALTPSKAATADDDPGSWTVTKCKTGVSATPGTISETCQRNTRRK